ncbi:DUF7691 family protein [Hyalangium versicolor]|uniref:DUF7691 family protein n=1 Tax=Hyalangium versicolor TaxID=2861190 RepID=UPI001CCFCD9D|nr:hypothetical protein [Hyalangium versicolor]
MGYQLEFYSLDLAALTAVIGSDDREVFESITAMAGRLFVGRDNSRWQEALEALILGERGARLSSSQEEGLLREAVSVPEATALVALVRSRGIQVASIGHASRGGPQFRSLFEPGRFPALFNPEVPLQWLLSRPLLRMWRDDYPCWGWLLHSELRELLRIRSVEELPSLEDRDLDGWLYELVTALLEAEVRGKALVTLYL